MFAVVCMYMISYLQTARGASGNITHVYVDGCSGLSMRARAPGPQTLLARLPSRLFDRTDSTDLLIRNRHHARDPPQLPKDATKWSIAQCYETKPLLVSLLNLDGLTTSHQHCNHVLIWQYHPNSAHEFVQSGISSTRHHIQLQQHSWPTHQARDVKHSRSSQLESSKLPSNKPLQPESGKKHEEHSLS